MSEIEQLKAQLEAAKADFAKARGLLVAAEAVESGLRCELERVQKLEAAMREAIMRALPTYGAWESTCPLCGNHSECGPVIHKEQCAFVIALQPDAGSDYIRREDVKPLVEALARINEISVVDEDMGYAVNWAGEALAHAETLGLL